MWTCSHRLLRQIVERREALTPNRRRSLTSKRTVSEEGMVLDEVKEIITLPKFDEKASSRRFDTEEVELDKAVVNQLRDFVQEISRKYEPNAFHNFEHASHVTMSVVKLLSRIVAPTDIAIDGQQENTASKLHDHTYGITSDPLTRFACVLSALIHDVQHPGVPNAQLIREKSSIAAQYNGKSIAEQNSVDLSWSLLMEPRFEELRATICDTDPEMDRFRQLVVNSVMATDIVDKELKALRNTRWEKAFAKDANHLLEEKVEDTINRKATIVIEHLIQASDVAHTMQHWHIYSKWNERFFMECYTSYKGGRTEEDPSIGWYEGEMGFFDFYIIPLAKKLKDCGVFGVSSDEYLNYATKNREEWEARGKEIVSKMLEKADEYYTARESL